MDFPNNASWTVNSSGTLNVDTVNANLSSFALATGQGLGGRPDQIPSGATNLTIYLVFHATTAPGTSKVVQIDFYRFLVNNNATNSWSSAQALTALSIPTSTTAQYTSQTFSLSTLGLTAGDIFQFELVRNATGDTLTGNCEFLSVGIGYT